MTPDKEAQQKLEASKKFRDFILKIDCGAGKPMLRAGFVIIGDETTKNQSYVVVATEGGLFDLKEMEMIRRSVFTEHVKVPKRMRICRVESCIPVDSLFAGEDKDLAMGLVLYGLFTRTDLGAGLFNTKTEPCHFASMVHAYFSSVPAGMKNGTSILMVGMNTAPHQIVATNNKFALVDLVDDDSITVRPVGTTNAITVNRNAFSFYDHRLHERSSQTSLLARMMTAYQVLHSKLPKKKGKR